MALTSQDWIGRLTGHLAAVVGALVEQPATVRAGTNAPSEGWVATLTATAGAQGSLAIEFDEAAAQSLTARILALDGEAMEPVVIDTLKEVCAQAAGALVQEPPFTDVKLATETVRRATPQVPADATLLEIVIGAGESLRLRVWGRIEMLQAQAVVRAPLESAPPAALAVGDSKLDVILDIDLPLVVRFGRTEMPLRTVAGLGPGSVIDLGRAPDEPVEILVSSQVVARGEVVVVGGNYGVRITDVVSPADRVRSMEVNL